MNSCIYEVNLSIQSDIAEAFQKWLNKHINDMLQIDGFKSCKVFEVESDSDSLELCCQYELSSKEALEAYFVNQAKEMRAEGLELFGDRFKASRRVLKKCL